ncbi:FAD-dependent monooxygenase [Niveispirillum sp.]|uniref:FAD-dependent monooxygenase n=1 Tax=Niveispirillum sp. TaxID=1917217 RepID=UPI001B7778C0|nr:FAD-dependent monooxygenase [Niveispirillum sp.]MBP7335963.1 FAD-dependent monooxygenase [Niveispirillum sp.]
MHNQKDAAPPQVIIVGAGPTGLALAIELGSRSIPCLVVEKNDRTGHAPRAKNTNIRTREHLRRWGIAGRLAEAAPFGVDYPSNILFVTRLGGHLITRFEHAFGGNPQRDHHYSEHAQWIPQYKLEAVLLDHARSLPGVRVEFGRELVGITQDENGVSAVIRSVDTGAEATKKALYLVGADGGRSSVRHQIGATMVGVHGLSRNNMTIFEAPGLAEAQPHGPTIQVWQCNQDMPSFIGPMDVGDRWFFVPTGIPPETQFTEEQLLGMIRRSTGLDLPYRILSSEIWVASRLLADRYSRGRIFLAGDACHLHPPFGGFGMNMGIADAVDLGWKLAAVLQGWGAPALLDTYEQERRPIHDYVMDEAEANHALAPNQLARDGIEEDTPRGEQIRKEVADLIWKTKRPEFFSLGVVLGYRYMGSPIIVDDNPSTPWVRSVDYVPSAAPGSLAPHRWLEDGNSLYDHFGPGFTLLVLDADPRPEVLKVQAQARHLGVPLQVFETSDKEVADLYQAPLVLIRPDQHVAWRGGAVPDDLMSRVCGQGMKAPHLTGAGMGVAVDRSGKGHQGSVPPMVADRAPAGAEIRQGR